MNKLAYIFGYLFEKQMRHEPQMSKSEADRIASKVSKLFKLKKPKIVYHPEDAHDPVSNTIYFSGSKPAFFHELGHYVAYKNKLGRIVEQIGNISDPLSQAPLILSAVVNLGLQRYTRMKPLRIAAYSLAAPAIATAGSLLPEVAASIRGAKLAGPKEHTLKYNILPALTYADPLVFTAAMQPGLFGIGKLLKLRKRFRR